MRSSDFRFGGAPEILVRAMSIASAEVPDMRPRTRRGRGLDIGGEGSGKTLRVNAWEAKVHSQKWLCHSGGHVVENDDQVA